MRRWLNATKRLTVRFRVSKPDTTDLEYQRTVAKNYKRHDDRIENSVQVSIRSLETRKASPDWVGNQTRPNIPSPGPCATIGWVQSRCRVNLPLFFISCARACTVACEVSTEAQFFADCKLHILTRPTRFGRWQFLEKILPFMVS